MKHTYKISLFLLFCALAFSACSFKKRLYTQGFYTSNNQSVKKPSAGDTSADLSFIKNIKQPSKKQNTPTLLARAVKTILTHKKSNYPNVQNATNNCDTIILKNGTKLLGIVTEVDDKKIHFKNCDTSSYFNSTLNKADVNQINFANGLKNTSNFKTPNKPNHRAFFTIGFILMFLALLFFILHFGSSNPNLYFYGIIVVPIIFNVFLFGLILCIVATVLKAKKTPKTK